MVKRDKELGEWKGTCVISGKLSIKRFEYGFTIKKRGESITEKTKFDRKTTTKDMTAIINNYYNY